MPDEVIESHADSWGFRNKQKALLDPTLNMSRRQRWECGYAQAEIDSNGDGVERWPELRNRQDAAYIEGYRAFMDALEYWNRLP